MKRRSLLVAGATALILAALIPLIPTDEPFAGFFDPWNAAADLILGWAIVSLVTAGLFLIWKAAIWGRESRIVARPRQMLPNTVLRALPRLPRRRRATVVMMGLPNYGLYWGFIPFILMMFFISPLRMPTGLMIHVPRRYAAVQLRGPESESLGVYVRDGGRFYVNGRVVPRDELRAKLEEELGRRVSWTVYFEADENINFRDAVYAIDTIRGLGAQVYWITPRVRQELNLGRSPAPQTLLPPANR